MNFFVKSFFVLKRVVYDHIETAIKTRFSVLLHILKILKYNSTVLCFQNGGDYEWAIRCC
jgi:hypothetical protein